MRIQLTRQERMGENGKGLLRLLQNESLPLIDLFIREAIQNSLDATLDNKKETIIDVGVSEFKTEDLAKYFGGAEEILVNRYSNTNPKAIYLSDKNTSGLTGAIRDEENSDLYNSKIYKLIYGISMNQTKSGAGGSWGLGKTSFFRLGNGIVIYYTRVQLDNGEYEERMAASLIEDSTKEDALLKDNTRGLAWWGFKESGKDEYDETYPITNKDEIHGILRVLGVEPYKNNETGTTVLIPFIDEKRINSHDIAYEENEKTARNWWEDSLSERIEMAIQKWYGIRILNKDYQDKYGPYLNISINGKPFLPKDFQTIFQKLRELYSYALRSENDPKIGNQADGFWVKTIQINRMALSKSSQKIVGDLAFTTLNKEELSMLAPDNEPHPLSLFGQTTTNEIKELNSKIIAYTRKPAMIVDYDIDGIWTQNVPSFEDRIILGIFVPRSGEVLHEDFQEELYYLDDYLRKSENADHASWVDVTVNNKRATIVSRIKGNVAKSLNEEFSDDVESSKGSKSSALGRKLGNIILPSFKKGTSGQPPINTTGGGGNPGKRKRRINYSLEKQERINENVILLYNSIELQSEIDFEMSIDINMGNQIFSHEKWIKDMEKPYPFTIKNVNVQQIADENNKLIENDLLTNFFVQNKVTFLNSSLDPIQVKVMLEVEINDLSILPAIQVKEVKK